MRLQRDTKSFPPDPHGAISVALSRYQFGTPDIRIVLSHILGIAPSRRSIRWLVKSRGSRLKHGRPSGTLKPNRDDLHRLIELTSCGPEALSGNTLHLLDYVRVQLGLSPRQYLDWVATFVRTGGYLLRPCVLCGGLFPSLQSGDRHCKRCRVKRRTLLKEYGRSILACSQ